MYNIIKSFKSLPKEEKTYAKAVLPLWLTFTIYMLVGIPVGGFLGFL